MTSASTLCAIYLRISLDATGQGLGVARQRAECERIARERGWTVFETYEDNSVSAFDRTKRRPQYERMVADFAAGKFVALVVWDLDRLTRQPRQLEDWVDAAEEKGLLLVTANGDADLGTHNGRMFARIKATIARGEMEQKSARQKLAAAQRFDRGLLYGGTRVTGYTSKGVVIESEAEVVRRIFDAFERGESVKGITEALRRDAVATRTGRPWSRSTVTDMLKNAKYAGRQTIDRTPTGKAGNWTAIVPEAQFDAVQARFDDPLRKHLRSGTDRKYLGSGLYTCSICGRGLQIVGSPSKTYACPAGHLHKSARNVDEMVVTAITNRLREADVVETMTPRDDARLVALTEKIQNLRRRLVSIEADYDAGHIDGPRFGAASAKVKADLDAAHRARADLLAGHTVGSLVTAPDPAQRFLDASVGVQRAVMAALLFVVLLPNNGGSRKFHPETVSVRWRISLAACGHLDTCGCGKVPTPVVPPQAVVALAT